MLNWNTKRELREYIKHLEAQLEGMKRGNKFITDNYDRAVRKNLDLAMENKRLVDLLKSAKPEEPKFVAVKAERLVGIKFTALFEGKYQPTVFQTGLGRCGKEVKWFTVKEDGILLRIYQHHMDGSRKEFVYRTSDIDGRVQYDYEQVVLTGVDAEIEKFNREKKRKARLREINVVWPSV